jgi:hypothetical protein
MSSIKPLCFAEAENDGTRFATIVRSNGHEMIADETEIIGGGTRGLKERWVLLQVKEQSKANV